MDTVNYQTLERAEIQRCVAAMSPQQLAKSISKMAKEQIESAAAVMTLPQFTAVVEEIAAHKNHLPLIPALLVGFPYHQFRTFIDEAPKSLIDLLKQESQSEALQHHINLFIHQLTEQIAHQERLAEDVNHAIEKIDYHQIDLAVVDQLVDALDAIVMESERLIETLATPIELAWNTGRSDLVDRLSYLKEHLIHLVTEYVGNMRNKEQASTGLYALLEQKLNNIYSAKNEHDIEALADNEPAIEGLTRLGLWYPKDYWQLGLLPHLADPEKLGNNTKKQDLLKIVRANLKKICLNTVGDLKTAHIYSRSMLQRYVLENQHLLRE
jgi:hypothetical protein